MQMLLPEQPEVHARLHDYGFALAAVAAALVLRYLLNPLLGQQGPCLILSLAIVVAAFWSGVCRKCRYRAGKHRDRAAAAGAAGRLNWQ